MNKLFDKLYPVRFELFFYSLVLILFGSLLVPIRIFNDYLAQASLVINVLAGILLLKHKKGLVTLCVVFLCLLLIANIIKLTDSSNFGDQVFNLRLFIYFCFYALVSFQIVNQVWSSKEVTKKVMYGLLSGYICIGLVAFFIFLIIETYTPGSLQGVGINASGKANGESIMYFSYITMMTIGYGEITPVTPLAQKATMMVGLLGQFYLVIIMAVVLEKYIRTSRKGKKD
ncbi:ion channel [Roseivirga pacifica]|uniref:Ion channel n=1 Tax=Roseivirga pacifica TaxID=1267423 RepID=A0A1I0MDW2_9BACT|nr:potassium channel family protein [Roseivirga pacifica]RKQ50247.1 ion channel [Roseivirga pacifica]SEV85591.1 Ion channel [Roseivirga pacifica]